MRRAGLAAGLGLAVAGAGAFGQNTFEWANPAGGDWAIGQNWMGGSPPFYEDLICFDLGSSYEVIGPPWYRGQRLEVRRGDITLRVPPGERWGAMGWNEAETVNPPAIVIGATPGEVTRLTTEYGFEAPTMHVAAGGDAHFSTDVVVYLEELVVGGAEAGSAYAGDMLFSGPDSRLFVETAYTGGRGRATIGLRGPGVLRLEDGAYGYLQELRMAVDDDSHGEIWLCGEGTRLDVLAMGYGTGSKRIAVHDGATLGFPSDYDLALYGDGSNTSSIVFERGSLVGLNSISTHSGNGAIDISGGSVIDITVGVATTDLRIRGAGSTLASMAVRASRRAWLTDGASILSSGRAQPGARYSGGVTLEGDVLIDDATIRLDDGPLIAEGWTFGSHLRSSTRTGDRLLIRNGAVVDVEGSLLLMGGAASSIQGPDTVVRQRAQRIKFVVGQLAGQIVDYGHAGVGSSFSYAALPPPLFVEDGAALEVYYLQVTGPLHIRTGAAVRSDTYIRVDEADLVVGSGGHVAAQRVIIRDEYAFELRDASTLSGIGDIDATVSNGGVVSPGDEHGTPGVLRISGDYLQARHFVPPSGVVSVHDVNGLWLKDGFLQIDIATAAAYDALEVGGTAELGGSLRVLMQPSYTPRWGDRFPFLVAGAIDGAFSGVIELPAPPPGLEFRIEATDAAVSLVVHHRTDLTRDLRIDGEDLATLLGAWGTPDDRADLTDDGVVDGADLGMLLGDWGASAR